MWREEIVMTAVYVASRVILTAVVLGGTGALALFAWRIYMDSL